MKSIHDSPILVTGAAGNLGAIGRNLTALLLAKGHPVGALVRREDEVELDFDVTSNGILLLSLV